MTKQWQKDMEAGTQGCKFHIHDDLNGAPRWLDLSSPRGEEAPAQVLEANARRIDNIPKFEALALAVERHAAKKIPSDVEYHMNGDWGYEYEQLVLRLRKAMEALNNDP